MLAGSFLWCIVDNIILGTGPANVGGGTTATAVTVVVAALWLVGHGIHGAAVIALPIIAWRRGQNVAASPQPMTKMREKAQDKECGLEEGGVALVQDGNGRSFYLLHRVASDQSGQGDVVVNMNVDRAICADMFATNPAISI